MTSLQTKDLESESSVVELDIELLKSPYPPLRPIDYAFLEELMRSIRGVGLLQPIVVRPCKFGFEVVFGNHRLQACRNLGKQRIRAIIAEFTEHEAFLARVAENLMRNSYVNPIEEAEGYRRLLKEGWTVNKIGAKIGKSDSYVCERLSLIDRLDSRIRDKATSVPHYLTPTHLELLSKVESPIKQMELAKLVEKKRLGVRALANIINDVPLPRTIMTDARLGDLIINIPDDFVKAAAIRPGHPVRIQVRGKKIIIEDPKRMRRLSDKRPSSVCKTRGKTIIAGILQ